MFCDIRVFFICSLSYSTRILLPNSEFIFIIFNEFLGHFPILFIRCFIVYFLYSAFLSFLIHFFLILFTFLSSPLITYLYLSNNFLSLNSCPYLIISILFFIASIYLYITTSIQLVSFII